jgi:hypothetical protein
MAVVRSVTRVLLISFLLSVSCSNAKIRLLLTFATMQTLALTTEKGAQPLSVRWCDQSNVWYEKMFNMVNGDCDLPDGVAYFTILFPLWKEKSRVLNFVFNATNLRFNVQFQHRLASISKNMPDKSNKVKEMYEHWYYGESNQEKEYYVDIFKTCTWGKKGEEVHFAICDLCPTDGREKVTSIVRLV